MRSWPSLNVVFCVVTCIVSVLCDAQEVRLGAEQRPSFDAVSIRQIEAYVRTSSPGTTSYTFTRHKPCVYSNDKVLCQLALGELIWEAYQRKRYQVVGPNWLLEDVFVFQAVLPGETSKENARLMMQRALEDRFGLRCHIEKRLLPVYKLIIDPGGLRLTPADPPDKQKMFVVNGRESGSMVQSAGKFSAVAMKLSELGYWVQKTADLERPVLDGTGLDDRYKIDLHWEPSDDPANFNSLRDPGIIGALKAQAGLVLRKEDAPVEMLVIDAVNRTPSPN